jgi:hypothetical protein
MLEIDVENVRSLDYRLIQAFDVVVIYVQRQIGAAPQRVAPARLEIAAADRNRVVEL